MLSTLAMSCDAENARLCGALAGILSDSVAARPNPRTVTATARTISRSRSPVGKNASPTTVPAVAASRPPRFWVAERTIATRARMLNSARLRALRVSGNSHMDPRARSAAMAASPGLYVRIETPPLNGTLGVCSLDCQYQDEREPHKQPRHEPGELVEPAVEEVRGSRQRRDGKEREQAVVAKGEVAHRVDDPVGTQPGQEPDETPEEERGKQRQDRLVPDRDPEVPGGGKALRGRRR